MGTPDFAVPSLKRLIADGHEIALVVTQPDKPRGRKREITPPPVKEAALEAGIPVYQPDTLRSDEAFGRLKAADADFFVVAAYGKILPKNVLDLPRYACVNVHGSLLPKYRGAAPIQRSVINGDKVAGVTIMLMAEGLDSGDVLSTASVEVGEDETAGELFDRLAELSPALLSETLVKYAAGEITPVPQNEDEATRAPMLDKSEAVIDWTKPAESVRNMIRGFNPAPVARTSLGGYDMQVYAAVRPGETSGEAAGSCRADPRGIAVVCGDGEVLILTDIRPEGGKRMKAADFLRGHKI